MAQLPNLEIIYEHINRSVNEMDRTVRIINEALVHHQYLDAHPIGRELKGRMQRLPAELQGMIHQRVGGFRSREELTNLLFNALNNLNDGYIELRNFARGPLSNDQRDAVNRFTLDIGALYLDNYRILFDDALFRTIINDNIIRLYNSVLNLHREIYNLGAVRRRVVEREYRQRQKRKRR